MGIFKFTPHPIISIYHIFMSSISSSGRLSTIIQITDSEFKNLFTIQSSIDKGAYGLVDKAINNQTKQIVALKTLINYQSKDTFEVEESIMKAFEHPNILKSLGLYYNKTLTKIILVTPFCSRGNLKNCLQEIRPMSSEFKTRICLQIAEGIKALHDKNYMHRDIKPANILFDENWVPKHCDFGFTKIDDDIEKSISVGTIAFRDPNITSGKYSKKCDIYSLGLVFFSIFNGENLFTSNETFLIEKEIKTFQEKSREKVSSLKDCPQEIKDIIVKCLSKDEISRPDASALVKKLEEVWTNVSIGHVPIAKSFRLQKFNEDYENRDIEVDYMRASHNFERVPLEDDSSERFDSLLTERVIISPKKRASIPVEYKGIYRILRAADHKISELEKVKNASTVYSYFINRRQAIRELDTTLANSKCKDYKIKMIIFTALFGYLRFLKESATFFLAQKPDSQISGVEFSKISEKTKEQCARLISQETKASMHGMKSILKELDLNKEQYRDLMPPEVKKMINEGIEKKFSQITLFDKAELAKLFSEMGKRFESSFTKEQNTNLQKAALIFI